MEKERLFTLIVSILCFIFISGTDGVDDPRYIGCLSLYGNHNFLKQEWLAGYLGSVDSCISACIGMKYSHARIRNGGYCSCSDGFMYYQHNEQACTQPCTHNNTQICGAYNKWESVYKAECPAGHYGTISPECKNRCEICEDEKPCEISEGWCHKKIQAWSSTVYLGCYLMTASDLLFVYWGMWSDHGDVFTCIYTCIKHGYTHAGLRIGDHCVCGKGLPVEERRINEEQCKNPCSKNQSQTCGSQDGDWISVYRADCPFGYWGKSGLPCTGMCAQCRGGQQCRLSDGVCPTTSVNDDPRYVGCFESYIKLPLSNYSQNVYGNVTQCINICVGNGFIYAGLKNDICYCGYGYVDYRRDETQCTFTCRNDQERMCGSREWTSVYRAVCQHGSWGASNPGCTNKCGHCNDDAQCGFTDGRCLSGCLDEWGNYPWCNVTKQTITSSVLDHSDDFFYTASDNMAFGTQDDKGMHMGMTAATGDAPPMGLIAGVAGGGLALLIIIIIILITVLFRHRIRHRIRHRSSLKKEQNEEANVENGHLTELKSPVTQEKGSTPLVTHLSEEKVDDKMLKDKESITKKEEKGPKDYINVSLTRPISLELIQQCVQEHMSSPEPFFKEYKSIPGSKDCPCHAAERPKLRHKNRFKDILPYDHSRVELSIQDNDPLSDYINASFIQGYSDNQQFIASQGPNKDTLNDFWRMIWEQNVTTVVMLTNLKENNKEKCSQYWPDKGSVIFGEFSVKMENIEVFPDFTIRRLILSQGKSSHHVNQFHFTSWPDHGVPQHAVALLNFHQKVNSEVGHPDKESPVLVHCSAGVGRTGAYLAIDYLLQQAEKEAKIDVMKVTSLMRESRPKMLQTREQYAFAYTTLLEAIWVGVTLIPCFQFSKVYEEMLAPDPYSTSSKIEEQYKMLESIKTSSMKEHTSVASSIENEHKNRSMDILPSDTKYVHLMTTMDGRSDYINAVFVDGRRHKNKFLVTQLPLPDTVVDFWRLVFDYKCPCIVGIYKEGHDQQVYWPTETDPLKLDPLSVTLSSETMATGITQQRQMTVTDKKKSKTHEVTQLSFLGWPTEGSTGPTPAAELFQLFVKMQQYQSPGGPILVHCRDGVGESGVFLALSNLCDMMNLEQELDVFHVVQVIRKNRPQFITSQEQYRYLYEAAAEYMDSFSTYSNFR